MEIQLNWIAIILAALSTMVVGSLWYGPLFGKAWAKLAKVNVGRKMGAAESASLYISAFTGSLITAIVLATIAVISHDFFGGSFLSVTIGMTILLWLGFTAARIQMHDSFETRPKQLTLLSISHEFVTMLVMALIIGVWPA
jgi:hypothetical protein